MTDQAKPEHHKPSARGEAAWKEERERIAERNAATRKAGREERETYERKRSATRRAREQQRQANLINASGDTRGT